MWKAPASGGDAVQVTTEGGFAAFESADRQWLYYAKGRSIGGLWRKRLATGREETNEALKPGYSGYWGLAPQGILFADRDSKAGYGLYLYQPGRSAPMRLGTFEKPVLPGDSGFAVSPDGTDVLYSQLDQSGSDIMLVNPLAKR